MKGRAIRTGQASVGLLTASALLLGACGGNNHGSDSGASIDGREDTQLQAQRALLDSLGSYPNAVLVREYVTADGALSREYGTFVETAQAASEVGVFYHEKLKALGWQAEQEHAAVSVYSKGNQTLSVMRQGPEQSQPTPDQKTLVTARHAVPLKFFFAIQAGLKP